MDDFFAIYESIFSHNLETQDFLDFFEQFKHEFAEAKSENIKDKSFCSSLEEKYKNMVFTLKEKYENNSLIILYLETWA